MTNEQSMEKLVATIDHFVTERDWSQFHSPKNLAMALSVETAELVEIFQWLSEEESFTPNPDKRDHIKEEIGDIMIYLTTLANKFNINPLEAAFKKMEINQKEYPAEIVRGKAKKYDQY